MVEAETPSLSELTDKILSAEQTLALGGGEKAIARQHSKGRLTARERISQLIDPETSTLELGAWAGWEMYDEYGGAPGAGAVCVIGIVCGRQHLIIANDATVKAGAFFPATTKKVLRAQRIAYKRMGPDGHQRGLGAD